MRARVAEVFTADVRSLAALRIVLALVVLLDLASRAGDLGAHYTDAGVLPRADLVHSGLMGHSIFSLNLISGDASVQGLLFAIAALAAVGLLVGFCTRLMTLIVWLLVVSIEWRNPLLWVLKDADGLDRVRLGDLDPRRLRTPEARALVSQAEELVRRTRKYRDPVDIWSEAFRMGLQIDRLLDFEFGLLPDEDDEDDA